jgi:hypothetical protein
LFNEWVLFFAFLFSEKKSAILSKKQCTVVFEKKKLMFIFQKLDTRIFLCLVGIEVFSELFHLMCHLFESDRNKHDTASKVFRQSPGM